MPKLNDKGRMFTDIFGNMIDNKQPADRANLGKCFYEIFKNITLQELVGLITNEFEETINYIDLQHGKMACQKTSLLFNPHRFDIVISPYKTSLIENIKTEKFCDNLARVVIFRKHHKTLVEALLYQSLQIGISSGYAYEFQPIVAKRIYEHFLLNSDSKILDPCAGWGGRMLGASVVCNSYTCFEPSTLTYNGLKELLKFIQRLNPTFNADINNLPFEESNLPKDHFDCALTSPPYYDTEVYSDETTNSCNRYPNFAAWADGFYLPLIQKTMDALKPNASFILNIGDRKYPLSKTMIDAFGKKYEIGRMKNFLINTGGLGKKKGLGEVFYSVKK